MSNVNLFEVATRTKMRFPYKGSSDVEQLWDLSVTELDKVFKALNSQSKQAKEESLLNTKSKEDEILDMKIEIVKYIVSVKLAEKEAREKASANREKNQKIMEIIAAKKDEALHNMSVEELERMLTE